MKGTTLRRALGLAVLLGMALAVPTGGAPDPGALVGGTSAGAVVGCIVCGGVGVAALLSGGIYALLWRRAAFVASNACIGVCVAALTT